MDSRSSRKHKDSESRSPLVLKQHRSKYRDTDSEYRCRRRSEGERMEDIDDRLKREKSYGRETSKDRHHHKRKDRNDDIDDEDRYYEAREKRIRVLDERKKRKRFEDKVAADREEKRRRFEDKKEGIDLDNDGIKQEKLNGDKLKSEVKDELFGGSKVNGGGANSRHPPSKVSPLSSKHENEGVNSNGTCADAGKSGGISRDAISKAKATLLKLAAKMKKTPMLNKVRRRR
ncbi:uncharacterized protein [Rutidosis leptorrhynchoides]|uniref:uncharacterized protein isoform X2 n=1 Tax=Rutidosis leptorrhynchoides TaxID=125765 RepID=UPI003A9A4434